MNYILKGGTIIDGTRSKPYTGSLVIKDGVIKDITMHDVGDNNNVIDVTGKIVSPGFIDIHSHSDICYLVGNKPLSKLYQGITTEIIGNCGISAIPISDKSRKAITNYFSGVLEVPLTNKMLTSKNIIDYRKELNSVDLPLNIGVLIGHGTLRGAVMGFNDRKPTLKEMDDMCQILEHELKNGALGLSLGLIYPPGSFSDTEEIIKLAKVIKDNRGILAVHMRNEGDYIFEAIEEVLDIARKTDVHLHISHLKLIGKKQWGKSVELLKIIDKEKSKGLNVTCDQYPYNATSTSLTALIPRWAHDGGNEKMLARLIGKSSNLDNDIKNEMESRGGASCIYISGTKGYMAEVEGLNIEEASNVLSLNPVDTVKKVLITSKGNVSAVYHSLNDIDIQNIIKKMYISVGSDGYAFDFNQEQNKRNPHPRSFGTFPKFLEMVRDYRIMPIEDAIYKMTKLNADILGLNDRGVLKPSKVADITVFDYEKIKDNSTFSNSMVKPSGVEHVFVNGKPALLYGESKFLDGGKAI